MLDEYTMAKLAHERATRSILLAAEREQRRCAARRVRAWKHFRRSIAQGLGGGLAPSELAAELRALLRANQAV